MAEITRMCMKARPCIPALAGGDILLTDLCPVCTRRVMDALDQAVGPLEWHQAYRDRAGVSP